MSHTSVTQSVDEVVDTACEMLSHSSEGPHRVLGRQDHVVRPVHPELSETVS